MDQSVLSYCVIYQMDQYILSYCVIYRMDQSVLNSALKIYVATDITTIVMGVDYYLSVATGIDDIIMPIATILL
jgi:hypothetical protein